MVATTADRGNRPRDVPRLPRTESSGPTFDLGLGASIAGAALRARHAGDEPTDARFSALSIRLPWPVRGLRPMRPDRIEAAGRRHLGRSRSRVSRGPRRSTWRTQPEGRSMAPGLPARAEY